MRVTLTRPEPPTVGPVAVQFSELATVILHLSVMSRLPFSTFTVAVLFFDVSAANAVSDTLFMPSVMTEGVAVTV